MSVLFVPHPSLLYLAFLLVNLLTHPFINANRQFKISTEEHPKNKIMHISDCVCRYQNHMCKQGFLNEFVSIELAPPTYIKTSSCVLMEATWVLYTPPMTYFSCFSIITLQLLMFEQISYLNNMATVNNF